MDKKEFIIKTFRKILKEDLQEKADSLMNKLNYDEEVPFSPAGKSFDYVQEGKVTCEQCGSEMNEGECSECGYKGEVMELGGMEDGHPRFGKMKFNSPMSDEEIERLLRGDDEEEEELYFDDEDGEEDLDFETDWTQLDEDDDFREIEEKLFGNQHKLDKNKNGRLDSEDFRMLRKKKTNKHDSEIDENFLKRIFGREKEEETPMDEPKAKPQEDYNYDPSDWDHNTGMPRSVMMQMDQEFRNRKPQNDQPREKSEKEKEYEKEFERLNREYGAEAATLGIDPREVGAMHARSKRNDEEEQLYEVEFEKEVDESETAEGNAFTGALADAKKHGKESFEVDGKKYNVKEGKKEVSEKWKGDVEVKQTGEYSDMSIEELNAAIKKQKTKNDKTKENGKKVSHADKTKMSQLYFAKRAKQGWKGKGKAKVTESILFTESDLIDLIERLVKEEKNSFQVKEPKGYKEYERAHKVDKKENEDYLKSVAKKMADYLKPVSDEGSKYEMKETEKFPTENGGLKKGNRKKYTPSDAVDEYIEAFSYPGQTNLVFDEVKPTEKNIEKYLKGHKTTGNAQVDEDGNALGNVVPSKVGEKFFKNFKDNLYGQEQMDASYKRQPQPVDQAGEETERGSLKSKRGKKTSQSVLNKVDESVNNKKENMLNEEFNRIQQLMGYNRKTQ